MPPAWVQNLASKRSTAELPRLFDSFYRSDRHARYKDSILNASINPIGQSTLWETNGFWIAVRAKRGPLGPPSSFNEVEPLRSPLDRVRVGLVEEIGVELALGGAASSPPLSVGPSPEPPPPVLEVGLVVGLGEGLELAVGLGLGDGLGLGEGLGPGDGLGRQ